jgi:hypothetical protein
LKASEVIPENAMTLVRRRRIAEVLWSEFTDKCGVRVQEVRVFQGLGGVLWYGFLLGVLTHLPLKTSPTD